MTDKIIKFKKPSTAWEVTKKTTDLIKAAEEVWPHTKQDSVGYYYYWMLQELKKLTGQSHAK